MKINYFWNKLLGSVFLGFAVWALLLTLATGHKHSPSYIIYAMQGMVITGGIWVTKAIWEY